MTYLLISILIFSYLIFSSRRKKPTNLKDWRPEQSVLAWTEKNENLIKFHNIRNFKFKSENDFKFNYYDKEFNINEIKTVDLVFQPFKKIPLGAHVFLSFGFDDGSYVSISIEARRKEKVKFSPFKGLLNNFELIYIVADEKDIMKFRPLYLKDKVYILPLKIRKRKIQKLFIDICNKINQIKEKPEFYNTFKNSCSTLVLKHLYNNGIIKKDKAWSALFPVFLDRWAHKSGLLKGTSSLSRIKDKHYINDKVKEFEEDENFSQKIRN